MKAYRRTSWKQGGQDLHGACSGCFANADRYCSMGWTGRGNSLVVSVPRRFTSAWEHSVDCSLASLVGTAFDQAPVCRKQLVELEFE